ncbi:MAG: PilW family protein [Candidatus Methylomirabilales bacterium]
MRRRTSTRLACRSGFTIVEVLITTVVMSMILAAVYTMFITSLTTYSKGVGKADIQQNARIALEQMIRGIRMAGYESPTMANPACPSPKSAACVIPVQNATQINVRGDIDGDDVTEEIEYRLQNCAGGICELAERERDWDDTTSTWGAWTPYEVAAINVKTLTITYLPAGNPTTVRVQLGVEDTPGNQNVAFTVGSDVEVRNL